MEIVEEYEIKLDKQTIRKFSLNFFTLAFTKENKELENHFLVNYYNKSLNKVRLSLFIAIIFYAIFGILDAAFIPDFEHKYVVIRYALVMMSLLSVLAFSFTRLYKKKIQFVSACLVVASSIGVVAMTVFAPNNFSDFYFKGFFIILITNYGFLRQRFIWATAAGFISFLIYVVVAFGFAHFPFLQSLMNCFVLLAINTVGIFIARHNERYARRYYFCNQLLAIERVKLRALNTRLEAKIKNKSTQINKMQRDIAEVEKVKKEA